MYSCERARGLRGRPGVGQDQPPGGGRLALQHLHEEVALVRVALGSSADSAMPEELAGPEQTVVHRVELDTALLQRVLVDVEGERLVEDRAQRVAVHAGLALLHALRALQQAHFYVRIYKQNRLEEAK